MNISVDLSHHQYNLLIEKDCLSSIGERVLSIWGDRKVVVITDELVDSLYGREVKESLEKSGFDVYIFSVVPGENSKSLDQASAIYEYLAQINMSRSDGIIALGGGVVGDLAGFVASTYMRGISFIQIPTTLLAQVDSSIGGKTAVNTTFAKNLIGTFYQPDAVFIDPLTLNTLDSRRIQEGLAEIIKSAAIKSKRLWDKLGKLESLDDCILVVDELIYECCQIKKSAVIADEFDHGERLLLNFGHTIAHGIEQIKGYGVVTHGEAVSIGMVTITRQNELFHNMGHKTSTALAELLTKFGLPIQLPTINSKRLYDVILHDKKVTGDRIKIVLLHKIGMAYVKEIPLSKFKDYL